MAQQLLNRGTTPGDGTGESLFDGVGKTNANFTELYSSRVINLANEAALPVTGDAAHLYKTADLGRLYRWTGSAYVLLNRSVWITEQFLITTAGASRQFEFLVPAGVLFLFVRMRGGGGSGGSGNDTSATNNLTAGAGGSAADGFEYVALAVTPGETLFCQVGHGGLAPFVTGQAGANGGDSYIRRIGHSGVGGSVLVLEARRSQ
jgi:hypothetical protein